MINENLVKFCAFLGFMALVYGQYNSTTEYALISCSEDADCEFINGTCVEKMCKCNDSYNCKRSTNILGNKLGESCESTSDCNIQNAICDSKKQCSCRKGHVASLNGIKCLKIANGLGGGCEESNQCRTKTPSTDCHEDKCVCQQHMHEYKGSCYKNVGLGQNCQLFEECAMIPQAVCRNAKCQCRENYISSGSECLLKANGLNFSCTEDVQCKAQLSEGAECSKGVCICKEVFHYKSSLNRCVHDILLNENCGKHSDCHQPGTGPSRLECVLGVCKCKSPYLEESGFCINSSTSVVLFKSFMLFLGTVLLVK